MDMLCQVFGISDFFTYKIPVITITTYILIMMLVRQIADMVLVKLFLQLQIAKSLRKLPVSLIAKLQVMLWILKISTNC